MPYKRRSYYRHEEAKARDYSLFVIACKGTKTEPSYFAPFDNFERIRVRILEHEQTESAPSHVLASAKKYMTEEGLNAEDGDTLWCVIDVDKWPIDMIKEFGSFCINTPGCHIAISNPFFEVWLLYHKLTDLKDIRCRGIFVSSTPCFPIKGKKCVNTTRNIMGVTLVTMPSWLSFFSSLGFFGFCASIAVLIENH